jgi:hypothetical protein
MLSPTRRSTATPYREVRLWPSGAPEAIFIRGWTDRRPPARIAGGKSGLHRAGRSRRRTLIREHSINARRPARGDGKCHRKQTALSAAGSRCKAAQSARDQGARGGRARRSETYVAVKADEVQRRDRVFSAAGRVRVKGWGKSPPRARASGTARQTPSGARPSREGAVARRVRLPGRPLRSMAVVARRPAHPCGTLWRAKQNPAYRPSDPFFSRPFRRSRFMPHHPFRSRQRPSIA